MSTGTGNPPGPFDIDAARPVLAPDGSVTPQAVTPDFYAALDRDFGGFAGHLLISQFAFAEPWPGWERHPHGDEFVYLLSGNVDFVLWQHGCERIVRVDRSGCYVVVPRGVWHTARPHAPTTMLFVTPGEGTEHADGPS